MNRSPRSRPVWLALAAALLAACGTNAPPPLARHAEAGALALPDGVWSDAPLAGAIDVVAARARHSDGDTVVLRGTLQEFGDLATFRLVEDSLQDCTETGDGCKTPWDYCCTAPEVLAAGTVNVEFLEGGVPADWSLRGVHGLERLTEVTVAGVLRFDEAGNMRLEATRLARQ